MRALGVTHLETPTMKITLTPDAPSTGDEGTEPGEKPDAFLDAHEHPDTYGGYVPHIKRSARVE